MIDVRGPSTPKSRDGLTHVFVYLCKLSRGTLLEPMRDVTGDSVRRAFTKCMFRSGVVLGMLRSDCGLEMVNLLLKELSNMFKNKNGRHIGTPWRP